MHKNAEQLKSGDVFQMAGSFFRIIDVYSLDDDDLVKIALRSSHESDPQDTSFLVTPKQQVFHLW